MQIKTTMRYHLTPDRMAIINKSRNTRAVEKAELFSAVGGNADWWSHCGKQYGDTSKKLKMDLPFHPVTPLLGLYLKEPKTLIRRT